MPRGSIPGERRGGRQKGTPNKSTVRVRERLDALGVDPIEGLARLAKQAEQEGDRQLAATCYKTLAEYCEPKRRAIEYTEQGGAVTDPLELEQRMNTAIREHVSRLSAAELAKVVDPATLAQLTGENIVKMTEAG